jgi:Rps23 Pro-64 3,4-dihydroxylase Tpa1-like proline 4-hydroxylase
MVWFIGIVQNFLMKFVWDKVSSLISKYWTIKQENTELEKVIVKEQTQAEIVRELSRQVTDYLRRGEKVPLELETQLKDEVRKLTLSRM